MADTIARDVLTDDLAATLAVPMPVVRGCLECHDLVLVDGSGACPKGHDPKLLIGEIVTEDPDAYASLARFNWGAFFAPFLWGPAHRIWIGAIFVPILAFMDSIIVQAVRRGGWMWLTAAIIIVATIAMMAWFGRTGSLQAYLRTAWGEPVARFNRRQRVWAVISFVFFVLVIVFATVWNLQRLGS